MDKVEIAKIKKWVKKAGGPLTEAEKTADAQGVIPFEGYLRVCTASAHAIENELKPVRDKFLKERMKVQGLEKFTEYRELIAT